MDNSKEQKQPFAHAHVLGQSSSGKTTTTTDELLGMAWWNGLDETQRQDWMARAGNTGVAADAWAAFKCHSAN